MAHLKALIQEILSHDKAEDSALRSDLQDEIVNRYNLLDLFKEVLTLEERNEQMKHLAICTVVCAKAPSGWFIHSTLIIKQTESFGLVRDTLNLGLVPAMKNKEHYCYAKDDFVGVPDMASTLLSIYNIMFENFHNEIMNEVIGGFLSNIAPDLMYLVLEHIKENLWTSQMSRVMSQNLLKLIKTYYKCESNGELLIANRNLMNVDPALRITEKSILTSMLKLLGPKLTKEGWTMFPSAKCVFQWCLFNTRYPDFYDYLERFLPPSLNFVDDFIMENRVIGVQCLQHIMENVSPEQLRWYGHADVIYQAVKHQLHTNEAELNEVSFPAILSILQIVEKMQTSMEQQPYRNTAKHDEIIHIILLNAECESKIVLRQIVTKFLGDFVDVMGLASVKHLHRILKLVESYLEVYDGQGEITRMNVLDLLERVVKNTWPRIPSYTEMIIRMLLKFLCSIAIQDSQRTETQKSLLVDKISTCLKLLKIIDGEKCEALLKSLESSELPPLCSEVLKDVKYSVDCTG